MDIAKLREELKDPEKIKEIVQLAKRKKESRKYNKLFDHRPYGHPDTLCPDGSLWKSKYESGEWEEWSNKPWQLDFHNAGKENQERMQICANRVGKSISAAYEVALHMTGLYPDWWKGRRLDNQDVLVWTGSPTNETSRDIVQKELLGGTSKEELGTGWIPRDLIIGKPKMRQAGVSDVVDMFKVRRACGGVATCILKTYEQGWRKWQGTQPDVVWNDEEPEDFKIYTEALTRLLTSHGIMMVTFTPLLGQTDLVIHFMDSENDGVWVGTATWDDAPHLNSEERARMIRSYPDHERQARTMGVPMMGEGRIFTHPEEEVICAPFEIPPYFAKINGIDIGIDHPYGFAALAWDRDNDIIYLYDSYKESDVKVPQQAVRIKKHGQWIPVAWPHDGVNRDKGGAAEQVIKSYRDEGVNALSRSARYNNDKGGAQPVWPIIEEIKERERTGRFKVFNTQTTYLEERRNYHIKRDQDGKAKIVNRRDDALKACFYAVMMKRYATTGKINTHTKMAPALRIGL